MPRWASSLAKYGVKRLTRNRSSASPNLFNILDQTPATLGLITGFEVLMVLDTALA